MKKERRKVRETVRDEWSSRFLYVRRNWSIVLMSLLQREQWDCLRIQISIRVSTGTLGLTVGPGGRWTLRFLLTFGRFGGFGQSNLLLLL